MHTVYHIAVVVYGLFLCVASLFSRKARAWTSGRRDLLIRLSGEVSAWQGSSRKVIWFHCASLGEYEMGRPVMEAIRKHYPECRLVVSFFSPSGYLHRKNDPLADLVTYLPLDTPRAASRWMDTVNPVAVFFIKYEYWFNFFREMERRNVPHFMISAVFRKEMLFFKSYGGWFRERLARVSTIFVQQPEDEQLLRSAGFTRVVVAGDTRFDRVTETVLRAEPVTTMERFCLGYKVVIAGSSWPEDERILLPSVRELMDDPSVRFVFAPHDISRNRIDAVRTVLGVSSLTLSVLELDGDSGGEKVLIIDRIGLLSRIYRYARVAFIGGAFGQGLHNILEAVAFGVPVLFGPKHQKFWEARALIDAGGAWSVDGESACRDRLVTLLHDDRLHAAASDICKTFVSRNSGAARKILHELNRLRIC